MPLPAAVPGLLTPSHAYKPFRYPWAYEFWKKQQQVHWLPEEVSNTPTSSKPAPPSTQRPPLGASGMARTASGRRSTG
jgi:hypothetical protein